MSLQDEAKKRAAMAVWTDAEDKGGAATRVTAPGRLDKLRLPDEAAIPLRSMMEDILYDAMKAAVQDAVLARTTLNDGLLAQREAAGYERGKAEERERILALLGKVERRLFDEQAGLKTKAMQCQAGRESLLSVQEKIKGGTGWIPSSFVDFAGEEEGT